MLRIGVLSAKERRPKAAYDPPRFAGRDSTETSYRNVTTSGAGLDSAIVSPRLFTVTR